MNRQDHTELEELFGDKTLMPSKAFSRHLKKQLQGSPGRSWASWKKLALLPAVIVLILVVSMVTMGIPARQKKVILSQLYSSAFALEPSEKGTLWRIDETFTEWPLLKVCAAENNDGIQPSGEVKTYTVQSLLYKGGNVTAEHTIYPAHGASSTYSEDPDIPAFDADNFINGQLQGVTNAKNGWVMTDNQGNALADNTTLPLKKEGTYDIYQRFDSANSRCSVLMRHIVIDAKTKYLASIDTYLGSMQPEKLIGRYKRTVKTTEGSFASVEGQFTALGFDKAKADVYKTDRARLEVLNVSAGYGFGYNKAELGKYSMTEQKNAAGQTTEYVYRFSAEPSMVYKVRTKYYTGTSDIATIADFRKVIREKGWTIETELLSDSVEEPDYGKVPRAVVQAVGGGKRVLMIETGTPDIPSVYAEVKSDFDAGRDQTGSRQPHFWDLNNIRVFLPGKKPTY